MKDKIKGLMDSMAFYTMKKNVVMAIVITLACADFGLFICTLIGADKIIVALLPLWVFVLFALLYFVLDNVPYTAKKWWIKAVVLAAAALLVILLVIFL